MPCSLALTRYCHHQYCMVCGIPWAGRLGSVCCAMAVQSHCNRVGFAGVGEREGGIQGGLTPIIKLSS